MRRLRPWKLWFGAALLAVVAFSCCLAEPSTPASLAASTSLLAPPGWWSGGCCRSSGAWPACLGPGGLPGRAAGLARPRRRNVYPKRLRGNRSPAARRRRAQPAGQSTRCWSASATGRRHRVLRQDGSRWKPTWPAGDPGAGGCSASQAHPARPSDPRSPPPPLAWLTKWWGSGGAMASPRADCRQLPSCGLERVCARLQTGDIRRAIPRSRRRWPHAKQSRQRRPRAGPD